MMPSTDLVMGGTLRCHCPASWTGLTTPNAKGPLRGLLGFFRFRNSTRRLRRVLAFRDFARDFGLVPDLLLREVQQTREHDQEDHRLEAEAVPLIEFRLRHPLEERRDVLRV